MPCCCRLCAEPGDGANHKYERESLSPIEDRKCQDLLWLVVFIFALLGSGYVSYAAVDSADLDVLRYGISSVDGLCGVGTNTGFEKTVYCINGTLFDGILAFCAEDCPVNRHGLTAAYEAKKLQIVGASKRSDDFWSGADYLMLRSLCVAPSVPLLNRCLYDFSFEKLLGTDEAPDTGLMYNSSMGGNKGNGDLSTHAQMFLTAYNDVWATWHICLICGMAGGLVLCFVWMELLKYSAKTLTWSTIALCMVAIVGFDLYLLAQAGWISNDVDQLRQGNWGPNERTEMDSEYQDYYKAAAVVALGITFMLFCILFALSRSINLAIQLVKEAADVIRTVKMLIFLPIVPVVFNILLFFYWVVFSVYLAACGEVGEGRLVWDTELRYSMIFHTAVVLWCYFFISALHSLVMAGTVASYYWTRDKNSLSGPVKTAVRRTLKYHTGSAALGSLVLTTVKLVKWYLTYLLYKFQKGKRGRCSGKAILLVVGCIKCCMACVERFIQFLTKNAYILIACDGKGFCYAAGQAWNLITSNVGRMTAVNMVTGFLFVLSKVMIALSCALLASVWINAQEDDLECSSSFTPMVVTGLFGYLIAWLFFEVGNFTVDTLMVCFCLDDLNNRGSGNYYASPRLVKFMASASARRDRLKGKKGEGKGGGGAQFLPYSDISGSFRA